MNGLIAPSRKAIGALVAAMLLASASPSLAERTAGYDPQDSGHPVKIAYYILYPVGFVIDILILRPAYWLGQHEPFRTVFGVDAAEFDNVEAAMDPEIPPEPEPAAQESSSD